MNDFINQFGSLGSDAYYFTIIESCKFIFLVAFFSGLFVGYLARELDNLSNFLYKLFKKYLRLRRIKRRSLSGRR